MMFGEHVANRFSNLAWKVNANVSTALGRLQGHASPESRHFCQMPMYLGKLSQQTLSALRSLILDAPLAEFKAEDHVRGYVFNPEGEAVKRIFQAGYRFRCIDGPQYRGISDALHEMEVEITRHLGSGWRVINLKSWSTRVDTVQEGPNAWHLDGFPASTYKLMIYLTPIGRSTGTTEVRFGDGTCKLLEGDSGTYLLFDPSTLWHRGIAPNELGSERTHIEITLMRSAAVDLRLAFGGLNSAYPHLPWTRRPIVSI
jgi:hypothetical protein